MTLNPQFKILLDFLPVAVFFIAFKWLDIYLATALLLAVTLGILLLRYRLERRIAMAPLLTACLVAVFGGLTLWLHDERFIKIKPTILYLLFSFLLLGGVALKRNLLKYLFDDAVKLQEAGWRLMSLRWGLFFLCMAALNEYVRRNYSTAEWVNFKVFGMMGLTFLFAFLQTRLIQRYSIEQAQP